MFARALIVLLVFLNLGVAAWWMARPAAAVAPPADPRVDGAPLLQLLRERPPTRTAPATAPVAAVPGTPGTDTKPAANPAQCIAFGPFADAIARDAARAKLQPKPLRWHAREAVAAGNRGWDVALPPRADRAAADETAAKLAAAGFHDYFIVAEGASANAIALGRYGTEVAARRREDALHAAGFADAHAAPVDPVVHHWLDIEPAPGFDAAAARAALGAVRAEPVDCAGRRGRGKG